MTAMTLPLALSRQASRRLSPADYLKIVEALDLGGGVNANLEQRGRRWRLRFRLPEGDRVVRHSLTLPDDPVLFQALKARLQSNQGEEREYRQRHRQARIHCRERVREEQRALRELRAAVLARCPSGRAHRKRVGEAFDLAERLDDLEGFLDLAPWQAKPRGPGRVRRAAGE